MLAEFQGSDASQSNLLARPEPPGTDPRSRTDARRAGARGQPARRGRRPGSARVTRLSVRVEMGLWPVSRISQTLGPSFRLRQWRRGPLALRGIGSPVHLCHQDGGERLAPCELFSRGYPPRCAVRQQERQGASLRLLCVVACSWLSLGVGHGRLAYLTFFIPGLQNRLGPQCSCHFDTWTWHIGQKSTRGSEAIQ